MSEVASCDEDTLTRAKAGQESAFANLVRAHQASIYSLAVRVVGDREQAKDVAQEAFLQLYRKLSHIDSARHLKFWLRKVAVNLAIDRLRHVQRIEFVTIEDHFDLVDSTVASDTVLRTQLLKFVTELPAAPRAVMLLRYQEDLDPLDISRTLDMPVNTVKSHLKRSLTALRERVLAADLPNRESQAL